jgi:sensor histidine kinase YesM
MFANKEIVSLIYRGITHVIFWIIIYFFYTYFLGYGSTETKYVNQFSVFLMPVTMSLSYFLVYYLMPKYLLVKNYKAFILYSLYAAVISVYVITLSVLYGLAFLTEVAEKNTITITKSLPLIIFGVFFVILIVLTLSMIKHNYKSIIIKESLEKKFLKTELELKENELKFLKMQIHPHFLFNTLNTIYGFALKKKDEAPEMILKLSNLLDYILYQVNKPSVSLQDEINHLEDYISLEEMRFHDTLNVSFDQNNINEFTQIAPMLLMPFLENSFKHGKIINGKMEVTIKLFLEDGFLIFKVDNSSEMVKDSAHGIGLKNIKKRLEMLYPNAYDLTISTSENKFSVVLKINVNGLKTAKNV